MDIETQINPPSIDAVAALARPLPSDLTAIIGHAADALLCYADTARWHRARAVSRGLEALRGTRAMDGAAERADDLATYLRSLAPSDYEFTDADWASWLEADFEKVDRSRRTVRQAAKNDFYMAGRDLEGPEYQQLSEIEHAEAMYAALSAVMSIADAIRFVLSGEYDPTKARVIAAEEMARLYANLRKLGQ